MAETSVGAGKSKPSSSSAASKGSGPRLGPFLCWAVVFADIGSSVYYTPGILFGQVGVHAALFVGMTLAVFVLLTLKYAEVAVRHPDGGGVVTVASHAFHPFAGLLGGMFILVDYFLTAALSALSGIIYLSTVAPGLRSVTLPVTLAALIVLGVLNLIGVSESAKANAAFATVAAVSQILVVLMVIVHVGIGHLVADVPRMFSGRHLSGVSVLTGYAGAFLAFSGLESISQLSPVMAEPRRRVTRVALGAVVGTIGFTSPLLTLWSTTVLPITKNTDPNQFISLLAGYAGGRVFEIEVAVSGALLLVFASNTAVIGSYHVFLALGRLGFLPQVIEQRNRLRDTPHWAILAAVGIPLLVLILTHGSVGLLGDLYAFGLLGAFSLTCFSLDIVRWHEAHPTTDASDAERTTEARGISVGGKPVSKPMFVLGILTTLLVSLAWSTNLFTKPMATLFGGGVTLIGLLIGLATREHGRRRGRPFVFPFLHWENYPVMFLSRGRRQRPPATVLALLPAHNEQIGALVGAANKAAAGGPIIFVQRGRSDSTSRPPRIFEIVNPYLNDPAAQDAFAQAERLAQRQDLNHRYLYLPSTAAPEAIAEFWRSLRPRDTLVVASDRDILSNIPASDMRELTQDNVPIVHYLIR